MIELRQNGIRVSSDCRQRAQGFPQAFTPRFGALFSPSALQTPDTVLSQQIIRDLYANPHFNVYCELGKGAFTPRKNHSYDRTRLYYQVPMAPGNFMGGSHAEFVKISSRLFVRDIGLTPQAKAQTVFHLDGSQLFPVPESLAIKTDGDAITPTECVLSRMPEKDHARYRAHAPLMDRVFQPLKNGDFVVVADHLFPIQGLPDDGKLAQSVRRPQAEADRQIQELLENLGQYNPEAERDPDATKVFTPYLVQLRWLLEPVFLEEVARKLQDVYGFSADRTQRIIKLIHYRAGKAMAGYCQQFPHIQDPGRRACIIDPATRLLNF